MNQRDFNASQAYHRAYGKASVASWVSQPMLQLVRGYPVLPNEAERLACLKSYDILDSPLEQNYDDLTAIAAHVFNTPLAWVSLLDGDRQWFKSRHGLDDVSETPREYAFCAHAIISPSELLVVPDAIQDDRFKHNPLVLHDPYIRFYAGAPLVNPDGFFLGCICVIDYKPRNLTAQQEDILWALSRQVIALLELRRKAVYLQQEKQAMYQTIETLQLTQAQLVESEKVSAVGQLVVDLTQKMSDPFTFIQGNLAFCRTYVENLLALLEYYQNGTFSQNDIDRYARHIDLDYIKSDLPRLFASMENGAEQIHATVQAMQSLKLHGNDDVTMVDLHESLDNICTVLDRQLIPGLRQQAATPVIYKYYGELVPVACIRHEINQALMHLVSAALESVRQGVGYHYPPNTLPWVKISTSMVGGLLVKIVIADNGPGLSEEDQSSLFNPSRLGGNTRVELVLSHQYIVDRHRGSMRCSSRLGWGTEMVVLLPIAGPSF